MGQIKDIISCNQSFTSLFSSVWLDVWLNQEIEFKLRGGELKSEMELLISSDSAG